MKIVILNNHSILNAGDYAILLETLALLEASFPGAQVALVFNDHASARRELPGYRVLESPLSLVAPLTAAGTYAFAPRPRRAAVAASLLLGAMARRARLPIAPLPAPQRALISALAEADLVLACGGGYLYAASVEETLGWFGFSVLGMLLTLLLGRPLALLPQSIGPLHGRRQRLVARLIARQARLTCVRERISLQTLQSLGAAGRALITPDLAFGHASAPPDEARALLRRYGMAEAPEGRAIGVTALNWAGQNHTFAAQARYERAITDAIDALTARGDTVAIFAQCCGPSAAEDDRIVARRIGAAARHPARVAVIDEPLPPPLLQAAYGCMDAFVGTRMHSVILAINAGVPAVAIGYLHKTAGVLAEAGLSERALDISSITGEQIVAALDALGDPDTSRADAYLQRAARVRRGLPGLLRSAAQKGGRA